MASRAEAVSVGQCTLYCIYSSGIEDNTTITNKHDTRAQIMSGPCAVSGEYKYEQISRIFT